MYVILRDGTYGHRPPKILGPFTRITPDPINQSVLVFPDGSSVQHIYGWTYWPNPNTEDPDDSYYSLEIVDEVGEDQS